MTDEYQSRYQVIVLCNRKKEGRGGKGAEEVMEGEG